VRLSLRAERKGTRGVVRVALALVLLSWLACAEKAADPLPSWSEGAAKRSLLEFVGKVTREGGPEFVRPAERIAVFDNDGTLWAEQPMYFQLLFALDRIKAMAPQHPEWREKEPFASLLRGDVKGALEQGEPAIAAILGLTHAGMTTDEFDATVREWFATAKHPTKGRPYTELVYQPMLEVLDHLRANGFKTYIVSGGGVEFLRAFAENAYGIPPEQVVGSTGKQRLEVRDGTPVLVKLAEVDHVDDKEGKPVGIQKFIGRRPIAAFGNSDGDLAMLQWTAAGTGPRFCLFVHHTDSGREWAYDRESDIGRLDQGLDEAKTRGWVIVSMKDDWNQVFPFEK
jgi:phosphoglycolate phosphatase-like HAD superfamily hydrolase